MPVRLDFCMKEATIVYEGIVREYDNSLLLKCELERRGYSVDLCYKTETWSFKKRRGICILPNGYSTGDIDFFRYILNANGNELISLQYEQVLSQKVEESKVHIPQGSARDMWLFCWGNRCKERLIENGITPDKIRVCGALQLDFLRGEFEKFYLSREEIAKKYSLNANSKWLFYISSFAYVNNPKVRTDAKGNFSSNFIDSFTEFSEKSYDETMEWFEKILAEQDDLTIIYRPHPVEGETNKIRDLEKKYPNKFYCISDLSVKQWILCSDHICTWMSTSIAEIFAANKSMFLLRPYPFPTEMDISICDSPVAIDKYDDFKQSILGYSDINQMPVTKERIDEFYSIENTPAFIRIADEIDKIYEQAVLKRQKKFASNRFKFMLKNGFIIKLAVKKVYQWFHYHLDFQIKSEKIRSKYYVSDWEKSIKHKKDLLNIEKKKRIEEIVEIVHSK